ncbi:MAG: hypothetical protein GY797_40280 [Deltaproteobacteria bacterium]|nr:hypothetical protein [Deltaproteobacteria bacterium]MCP4989071.1 hypothetical protein [Colwellia sp.]
MYKNFPLPYRWFISKGLTNWEPWSFIDDDVSVECRPDFSKNKFAVNAFKNETASDFDIYLFARRQDRDDFAFFVIRDGKVEDRVISIHLSFAGKLDIKQPLKYEEKYHTFLEWINNIVIQDVDDWMEEEDL